MARARFSIALPQTPPFTAGDAVILVALAGVLYVGARLAFHAPAIIAGPEISLRASALPWYAVLSVARMSAAYLLAIAFSLTYGYYAARNRTAEKLMMPLLDVLQSVPILSFLPVVLLSLSVVMPVGIATELAAIVLIFTSQAWNITFSFYQSMKTVPAELREAASVMRLGPWLQFRFLELPFAGIGLVWNSIMSWAGGWFFLMAAEMFTVGSRDFRLPGLGSYLQSAAREGDVGAVLLGVATLIAVVVALDQLLWRPLLALAERVKLEATDSGSESASWFRDLLARSWLVTRFIERFWTPLLERLDARWQQPDAIIPTPSQVATRRIGWRAIAIAVSVGALILYAGARAAQMLYDLPGATWLEIAFGLGATFLRVLAALAIAAAWTIPLGVAIGTRPRLAAVLQPMTQIMASIPATALFPIILLGLLHLPGGLDLSAVLLMLLGTQWYLLFNVIAGASAIPRDLRDTSLLLRMRASDQWRTLYLPALFPYAVTGAITAVGGAWNASIVAEYVDFAGTTYSTVGIGSLIARATAAGDYALLLAATLSMVVVVVLLNRLFWVRLYRLAESRYRMD